jgi:SAM-dependent methyltransferase
VGPGWRCLEAGAGAGTVARWLAGVVGPSGHVTATDLDTRFLIEDIGAIEVRHHDVTRDPLEPDGYDLVHARMLVEHLADRPAVVARLAAAVRPGGVLMLEDLLFGGSATAAFDPGTSPADQAAMFTKCTEAFSIGLRAAGADPQFGVRLPAELAAAGLRDVQAEFTSRLLHGGSPGSDFYTYSLRERGAQLVAVGLLTQVDVDACVATVTDPASFWFSVGLISAWGRRP